MRISGKNIRGFTLIEMLVAMALTSAAIGFSYSTLTYTQKLFSTFSNQNRFINEWISFRQKVNALFSMPGFLETDAQKIFVEGNSSFSLDLDGKFPVFKINGTADTFHFQTKQKFQFEIPVSEIHDKQLLKALDIETVFKGQVFRMNFTKEYDSFSKLEMREKYVGP